MQIVVLKDLGCRKTFPRGATHWPPSHIEVHLPCVQQPGNMDFHAALSAGLANYAAVSIEVWLEFCSCSRLSREDAEDGAVSWVEVATLFAIIHLNVCTKCDLLLPSCHGGFFATFASLLSYCPLHRLGCMKSVAQVTMSIPVLPTRLILFCGGLGLAVDLPLLWGRGLSCCRAASCTCWFSMNLCPFILPILLFFCLDSSGAGLTMCRA